MYKIEVSHKGSTIVDLVFHNEREDLAERVADSHRKAGATVTITHLK